MQKMYSIKYFSLLLILLTSISISSCRINRINVRVYYPPQKTLENINSITIINRTKPDTNIAANKLESVLSGESVLGDKYGAEDCIYSFFQGMSQSKYRIVFPQKHVYTGGKNYNLTETLPWDSIKRICRINGTDALAVLESFDTNSDAIVGNAISIANIAAYGNTPSPVINFTVRYHFRIYDTLNKIILDDYRNELRQSVQGVLPMQPLPTQAVRNAGSIVGDFYASQFTPAYDWQMRKMYRSGNYEMKIAARNGLVNQWTEAMNIWNKYTDGSKGRKVAGRACFNMALGYEVLGQYDNAIAICKKSYSDYRIRKAKKYLAILYSRPKF
jgi:hypothetical protein